jgi:hypothetical protein
MEGCGKMKREKGEDEACYTEYIKRNIIHFIKTV